MNLKDFIRDVADFPKAGVLFKDITPLLQDPKALAYAVDALAEKTSAFKPHKIGAIESRGFIFGAPLALKLGIGFVPVRKPGKLPAKVHSQDYVLEYGHGHLEIHQDAFAKNEKVLIVDDLLATGGTAQACQKLVEKAGAFVAGFAFLIELKFLKGRQKLGEPPVMSLLDY